MQRILKKDILFYIIAALTVILLIWKIPYGWGAYDEPYYIAIPHRILMGDAYFLDEWNAAQMSSILLLLPVYIYEKISGGTEGIVIAFRALYVILQAILSLLLYFILKKRDKAYIWAIPVYLIYIPLNIMSLNYDSMGLAFMMLNGTILACLDISKFRTMCVCGILFACAVLCNPFLALLYAIYAVTAIAAHLLKKQSEILNMRAFAGSLAGVGTVFIIFLVIVFSRISLPELFRSIPYILNDKTHGSKSFFDIFVLPLIKIYRYYSPWCFIWAGVFMVMLFDKHRKGHGIIYFGINSAAVILCLLRFSLTVITNLFMVPFSVMGLTAYILSENKEKRIFSFMWLWGVLYAAFLHLASDQDIYVISMALAISDAASVILCISYAGEQIKKEDMNKYIPYIVLCLIAAQLLTESISMSRNTYWESVRTENLDTFYTRGPLKGLRTTGDKVETYDRIIEDIEEFKTLKADGSNARIAFMTLNTWEYLYVDLPYGTFSPWIGYVDENTAERFELWCRLHEDKIPEYIYFSKLEDKQWNPEIINDMARNMSYTVIESNISYKLLKK